MHHVWNGWLNSSAVNFNIFESPHNRQLWTFPSTTHVYIVISLYGGYGASHYRVFSNFTTNTFWTCVVSNDHFVPFQGTLYQCRMTISSLRMSKGIIFLSPLHLFLILFFFLFLFSSTLFFIVFYIICPYISIFIEMCYGTRLIINNRPGWAWYLGGLFLFFFFLLFRTANFQKKFKREDLEFLRDVKTTNCYYGQVLADV